MEGPGVLPLATKMSSGSGREFKHLGLKYKHLWPVLDIRMFKEDLETSTDLNEGGRFSRKVHATHLP